ncbi:MAG: serine/threonine protein kinase, partial [Planctomycetes bacterium]|nr:serine/threonine protein kinase [Planctomycetota bacterium]
MAHLLAGVVFKKILVELGLVSPLFLDVFSEEDFSDLETIGGFLVEGGHLTPVQFELTSVVYWLCVHRETLPSRADLGNLLFGALAVKRGSLTIDGLKQAWRAWDDPGKRDPEKGFPDYLCDRGFLSKAEADALVREKNRLFPLETGTCPACGGPFVRKGLVPGRRARCRRCGSGMTMLPDGRLALLGKALAAEIPDPSEGASARDRMAINLFEEETLHPGAAPKIQRPPKPGPSASAEPSPAEAPAADGSRVIGKFLVEDEIARGGMGIVYRGRDLKSFDQVAIKVMLAGEAATAGQVQRFKREIRNVSRLDHPGIVRILDWGEVEGRPYYAMEFVGGGSFKTLTAQGPLNHRRASDLMAEVLEAMAAAHGEGIVHRDLKPENILLDESGRPKIADFGLAKDVGQDTMITREGSQLGTPAYSPPEQAKGKLREIDERSDLYSLGAIFYELLCGQPPFSGKTKMEVYVKVIETEPKPLRAVNAKVPRELEAICQKAMAKRRFDRYRTAEEFREDILRYLSGQKVEVLEGALGRQIRAKSKTASRAAAGLLVAGALIAGPLAALRTPTPDFLGIPKEVREAYLTLAQAYSAAGEEKQADRLLRRTDATTAEREKVVQAREETAFQAAMSGDAEACSAYLVLFSDSARATAVRDREK